MKRMTRSVVGALKSVVRPASPPRPARPAALAAFDTPAGARPDDSDFITPFAEQDEQWGVAAKPAPIWLADAQREPDPAASAAKSCLRKENGAKGQRAKRAVSFAKALPTLVEYEKTAIAAPWVWLETEYEQLSDLRVAALAQRGVHFLAVRSHREGGAALEVELEWEVRHE